jgi:arginine-tRNA-protein transferase
MVYSFYDPALTHRGLGNFLILDHVQQVKSSALDYVYLGYWVKDSPKMAYKRLFAPLEVQRGPLGWVPLD